MVKFRAYREGWGIFDVESIDFVSKTLDIKKDRVLWDWHLNDCDLMQYIGREDIKEKQIFEDDIVRCPDETIRVVEYCDNCCAYELIKYIGGIKDGLDAGLAWTDCIPWEQLEIIGNIWENEELIE
jgi:uncharacterized phage protein (TIGR01671 family)